MAKSIPYAFNSDDVEAAYGSEAFKWLSRNLRAGKIVRIRNGLYCAVDFGGVPLANKFEIASKIAPNCFVAYHSALEFYGLANQVFNEVAVGGARFRSFTFDGVEYFHVPVISYEQVIYRERYAVRVTSLERTVIDCIDKIARAGGIDEVLEAFGQIKAIDEGNLLAMLKCYNSVFLYQKTGYILEHFARQWRLSRSFFAECRRHLTRQVKYFLDSEYRDIAYNPKWRLMAPKNLFERGGF